MVRVGNETSDSSEQSEGLDFEMCRSFDDFVVVQRDVGIVLLVDVEIFDQSLVEERVERHLLRSQQLSNRKSARIRVDGSGIANLHVHLLDFRSTILDNDHRPTNSSLVRSDMDTLLAVIDVNRDEFRDLSGSTKETELSDETRC